MLQRLQAADNPGHFLLGAGGLDRADVLLDFVADGVPARVALLEEVVLFSLSVIELGQGQPRAAGE